MTAFFRSIFFAALLCAGTAWAQSDTPANPHSTKAKDQPGTAGSMNGQDKESAESANPHDVNQRKDADKTQGDTNADAAESNNPEHPGYRNHRPGSMNAMDHGQMSGADHDMMMKNASPQMMLQALHMANLEEIKMGKLAEQNGTERVKSYAKTLQQDHSMADEKVKDLAQKKGWTLNDTPKNEKMQQHQQAMQERMSNLKGAQFDRTFANMMVNGHQRLIHMAQAWSQNVKDQDVRSLLEQIMPKLQQHEQMAEQLKAPAAQGRAPDTR